MKTKDFIIISVILLIINALSIFIIHKLTKPTPLASGTSNTYYNSIDSTKTVINQIENKKIINQYEYKIDSIGTSHTSDSLLLREAFRKSRIILE